MTVAGPDVGYWIVAAGTFLGQVDADVDTPIPRGGRLLAWRIADDMATVGPEALASAASRAWQACRGGVRAFLSVGVGAVHGGTLLGWTAGAVERRARHGARAGSRGRPVLSVRLRVLLETIEDVDALALRACARPSEAELHLRLAETLGRVGRHAEAARAFDRASRAAAACGQDALRAQALPQVAYSLLKAGDAPGAARQARRALRSEVGPRGALDARRTLALAQLALGDVAGAERSLAAVVLEAVALRDDSLAAAARVERLACGAALGAEVDRLAWEAGAFAFGAMAACRGTHADRRSDRGLCVLLGSRDARWPGASGAHVEWALAACSSGAFDVALARWDMLERALGWREPFGAGRAGRIGRAWTLWLAGRGNEAEVAVRALAGDPSVRDAEAQLVAFVAGACASGPAGVGVPAEGGTALVERARSLAALDRVEASLADGVRADLGALTRPAQVPWMAAALRARLLRDDGRADEALLAAETACERLEAATGAPVGRWGPMDLLRSMFPVHPLAADLSAAHGAWDRVVHLLEADSDLDVAFDVRALVRPAGPIGEAVSAGLGAATVGGLDVVTLGLGVEDAFVIPHHGPQASRLRGVSAALRALAEAAREALVRQDGPMLGQVIAELSSLFANALGPLAGGRRPLAVMPHGALRVLPWEQVRVGGRELGAHRPVVELLSIPALALYRPARTVLQAVGVAGRRGIVGADEDAAGGRAVWATAPDGGVATAFRSRVAGVLAPRVPGVPGGGARAARALRSLDQGASLAGALRVALEGAPDVERAAYRIVAASVDVAIGQR